MTMTSPLYAVYPGSVTDYSGVLRTFTAEELATLYGVQDEDYLVVESELEAPQGTDALKYIHLKPRADNFYRNIKDVIMDDDQEITMSFMPNPDKIHQTDDDGPWIDPEEEADRQQLADELAP